MEERDITTHPRYRTFPAPPSTAHAAPHGDSAHLSVVFFRYGAKMRSHAVKHCADMNELETMKCPLLEPVSRITTWVDAIKGLGCPFFLAHTETPPCWQQGNFCPLFNNCADAGGRELEKVYLDLCTKAIENAIAVPRCAALREKRATGDKDMYHLLSDFLLLARLEWEGNVYNLKSCFVPLCALCVGKGKLRQTVESVRDSIIRKASGRIHWITPETWSVTTSREKQEIVEIRPSRKHKKQKSRPHKQYLCGSGNWRQWLDSIE